MGRNLMAYKGIKRVLALVSLGVLLQTIAIIFQAKWLAEAITSLFNGKSLTSQIETIGYFIVAFLARHLCSLLIKKILYKFGETTVTELRSALLQSIFKLGPRYTKREGTGHLVTFLIEGLGKLRDYLELFIPKLVAIGITPWLVLIYIWFYDHLSALILLITMPILIVFMILLGLAAQKKIDAQWASYRLLSNHFVDSLRGLRTLKFLGRSKEHGETIEKVSGQYRKSTMGTLRIAFLSTFALDLFTQLSIAIVAVMLGLRLIDGTLTLEPALLVLLLSPEYFLPIREVGNDYHATLDGKEAGEEILAVIKKGEEVTISGTAPHFTKESTITFQNVDIHHAGKEENTLHNLSFQIKGNQKVGIMGMSGAGKSTLIDALSGFLSINEGAVRIDGEDVQLTSGAWQEQTVYIPQHPFIFTGSIKENIRFYQPDASDEGVRLAIRQAGLGSMVARLPHRENEIIGEGGRTLSGGQAQRIALARAFLSERSILLFDEPTAQLDVETEYDLKEVLLHLSQDKLMFFASHRLHWMKEMDVILVMEDGQIVEVGTHKELIEKNGAYKRLLKAQMGDAS
ncbi:thiol reductant ABC exporter subunit CydD [Priestia filamentosa]|uniref:thiol reductant ABC exporter subunit CydD n=1 Tax=Priestia filamentosa TaxID=1402861 RepID=UPI003979FB7B